MMVYAGLIAVAVIIDLFFYGMDTLRNLFVPPDDSKYPPTLGVRMLSLIFLGCVLLATYIRFYIKKVLAYKRDAESGMKERIAYTIVRKEYFPETDQYFVTFDDPDYMHHETNRDTWYNCHEGGYFFIYRAKKSKYVFEESGRFSII